MHVWYLFSISRENFQMLELVPHEKFVAIKSTIRDLTVTY